MGGGESLWVGGGVRCGTRRNRAGPTDGHGLIACHKCSYGTGPTRDATAPVIARFPGRSNDTGRGECHDDLSGLTNALAQTWICAPRVTGESPGSIPAPLPIVGGGRRQVGWVAPLDLRDVGPRRANFFRESRLRPAHQRPFLLDIATHPGRFHIPILDRSRYLTSP